MKRPLSALAVLALGLTVAASPAAGAAPERYTDEFDFEDTIDCSRLIRRGRSTTTSSTSSRAAARCGWTQREPIRAIEHILHRSNDVNSVTGFTLHEHNHYRLYDFVGGTMTLNGAINIMERPGAGQVIHDAGHKILDLETGEPLVIRGPDVADDEAFCAAVAPRPTRCAG